MKKLLILSLCLFLSAQALAVKAVWDPSPGATGYKLYLGKHSGSYEMVIDCGNYTEWPLIDASYSYIVVTAYNEYGESEYSEELSLFNYITCICDLDGNGQVASGDFEIFKRHYGKICKP